jgi:hypothetical protein
MTLLCPEGAGERLPLASANRHAERIDCGAGDPQGLGEEG